MDRLIVKNFGPLKDVDIELNKINLFIGENGSGKSVLGKIITICKSFDELNKEKILQKLNEYNINFITHSTVIEYILNNKSFFIFKDNNLTINGYLKAIYWHDFLKSEENKTLEDIGTAVNIEEDITSKMNKHENTMLELINELKSLKKKDDIEAEKMIKEAEENLESLREFYKQSMDTIDNSKNNLERLSFGINKSLEPLHQKLSSQYIPAERNLISLFNKSLTTLLVAEVPLPKFLLLFSSEFEKAGNELKELEFLNVKYINGDGLDRHKVYFNDEDYLALEHSSSGIQSSLPLYLTVKYFADRYSSIIIEEPEQNLFPKAQAETIKYIVEQISSANNLFLMTHSPYVLSTLNMLMMAYKAGKLGEEVKTEVNQLINEKQWIDPNDFSAYYLENGVARDIKGRTGLISDNEIDDISDDMTYAFEELLTIYREHKNDK